MIKKFNLNNLPDCRTIASACDDPVRIFSILNRLGTSNYWGHKKNPTDSKSTPFQIFEIESCRRPMLQLTDASLSEDEKKSRRDNKHGHMKKCDPCFMVSHTFPYYNASDTVYTIVVADALYKASIESDWGLDGDEPFFYTDDMVGCLLGNPKRLGNCIQVHTGLRNGQNKNASFRE